MNPDSFPPTVTRLSRSPARRRFRTWRDSSGSIAVSRVGGDFVVDHDGSGSIDYDGVKGRVDIPRKDRYHRYRR